MALFPHAPVLQAEVLEAFYSVPLYSMLDGTLGAGGHAEALLKHHPEINSYIGLDQDPQALALSTQRLQEWSSKLTLIATNFAQFDSYLKKQDLPLVNGILIDLGVSSMQLDQAERGFSFMREGPLDMRMNPESALTAAEIVNTWSERELGRIFREYGEEKLWRPAAYAIIKARVHQPIHSTLDLVKILDPVLRRREKKGGIHPLTLVFQALRICVNQELEVLEIFLNKAIAHLAPGGRLAVISFHSLEDRLVKNQMRFAASDKWETAGIGGLFRDKTPLVKLITKKPITPSDEEMQLNPRSRSAKLRVIEKLDEVA